MHRSALVLFSGGQDSTTCLAWSLARYPRVKTIGFDYGQRHAVELEARGRVFERLRAEFPARRERLVEDRVVDLRVLHALGETALTREMPASPTAATTR